MTQLKNEISVPPPTRSQLKRTELILEMNGISMDSIGDKGYRKAFLQVISDIASIDKLHEAGVDTDQAYVISHSASFQSMQDAERFERLAQCSGYLVEPIERNVFENLYKVLFQHSGTFALHDILSHTMTLDKSAIQMNGDYDGWELVIDYIPLNQNKR